MVMFRRACQRDLPAIMKLHEEIFHQHSAYDQHYNISWPTTTEAKQYFAEMIDEGYGLLAEEHGEIVGMILAYPFIMPERPGHFLEAVWLGVAHAYQRQRIGSQLLLHLETWAKQNGYDAIYVNSYKLNEDSHRFYAKHGYAMVDVGFEKWLA